MKITIIGCGWLGLPLGEYLAFKGYEIKGSTTRISKIIELKNAGIEPFLLKLSPEIECENFVELIDSEVIIINIPPRVAKNRTDFHLQQIKNLIIGIKNKISVNSVPPCDQFPQIIFISSTSVYPDDSQMVTEDSMIDENHVLIKVEDLLKKVFDKLTILRAGGLMGYDRFPAKYYSGKPIENWSTGVNYIHRDDAILLIFNIIENNTWNQTFNAVAPEHPSRKEILIKNCQDLELDLPLFLTPNTPLPFKIISPQKLLKTTDFRFKYNNPLDFYYEK
jgi:nucleoside-diphosphate-sugar epimerase